MKARRKPVAVGRIPLEYHLTSAMLHLAGAHSRDGHLVTLQGYDGTGNVGAPTVGFSSPHLDVPFV